MGGRSTHISPKKTYRWQTDIHEQMLKITNQWNTNQNQSGVSLQTGYNGYYQKDKK